MEIIIVFLAILLLTLPGMLVYLVWVMLDNSVDPENDSEIILSNKWGVAA